MYFLLGRGAVYELIAVIVGAGACTIRSNQIANVNRLVPDEVAIVASEADEQLEGFLTQSGLAWSVIPWERHVSLNNEWEALYGDFHRWLRKKQGAKAQFEYSQQAAETFLIVPFLGNVAGPHSINKRGPRKAAYECHGDGTLLDLSAFAGTDFFIVPDDWNWTMMHTHEDYGLGGPYFIRRDWLGVPTRRRVR